jgi:CRP/FNR family transcriptional regulator
MSQLAAGAVASATASGRRGTDRMGRDWAVVLAEVPLFGNVSRRHLRHIASLGRARRYSAGTSIVRAGDPGSTFYVLIDGTVRVVPASGRARRLRAGDFFGEMALFDEAPRSATVVAEDEVLTMAISRSAFSKLLKHEPSLSRELLRAMAARLRAAEKSV